MKVSIPVFLVLFVLFTNTVDAQRWRRDRKELTFGLGVTNFLGDLGGADRIGTNGFRDLEWAATRPLGSIGYRYRTGPQHSVKGALHFGYLNGDDALTNEPVRNNRNLNFRTPVVELNGQFEWLLTREREGHRYNLRGVSGWKYINFQSYLFVGAGLFWFNPQGQYSNGTWHNLKPLCTEGQGMADTRKKYSSVQFCIPMGAGLKFAVSEEWQIGLEIGFRKTFTDYIDDVSTSYFSNSEIRLQKGDIAAYFADPNLGNYSGQTTAGEQRGDPTDNDFYMFGEITFYYKLQGGGFAIPKF